MPEPLLDTRLDDLDKRPLLTPRQMAQHLQATNAHLQMLARRMRDLELSEQRTHQRCRRLGWLALGLLGLSTLSLLGLGLLVWRLVSLGTIL